MSIAALDLELDVPPSRDGKTSVERSDQRIDLRVSQAMKTRLEHQAARLGLKVAAYIKQALARALEADEATDPAVGKRPKK